MASCSHSWLGWVGFGFLPPLSWLLSRGQAPLLDALSFEPSSSVTEPLPLPCNSCCNFAVGALPKPLFSSHLLSFSPTGNCFNQNHIADALYNNNPLLLSPTGFQASALALCTCVLVTEKPEACPAEQGTGEGDEAYHSWSSQTEPWTGWLSPQASELLQVNIFVAWLREPRRWVELPAADAHDRDACFVQKTLVCRESPSPWSSGLNAAWMLQELRLAARFSMARAPVILYSSFPQEGRCKAAVPSWLQAVQAGSLNHCTALWGEQQLLRD